MAYVKKFYKDEVDVIKRDSKLYLKVKGKEKRLPNKPRCFADMEQWVEWCRYAILSNTEPSKYCLDCNETFQKEMITERRCNKPKHKFNKEVE